jgi:hypothetical protein
VSEPSIYDVSAPTLREHGYFVLPIGPGTKEPMHWVPSLGQFKLITSWTDPRRPPEMSPQPNAGIGLRCGHQPNGEWIVAIDWDNEDAAIASLDDTVLASPICKQGKRGFTSFYRSTEEIPSHDFLINEVAAVQVLSKGRQTVLPPTRHKETGLPYTWTDKQTLYNCSASALPLLPGDYIERIERILRPLGYAPEPSSPERPKGNGHDQHYDDESPFKRLNDKALRNLALWVPDLNLYRCRRSPGRGAGYEAIATWRPSSTGRPLKKRGHNLKISPRRGIKDFGNGETFSPINLVMRARECSRPDAVEWLQERLLPNRPDVDFETLTGTGAKTDTGSSGTKAEQETRAEQKEEPPKHPHEGAVRPEPPASLGEAWHFGDPVPAQIPMLVPGLLPQKGYGYLGGQWGTFKSFTTNDLAVAVASKGMFAGQRVTMQGAVVQIELEGSHTELRLKAAASHRNVDGKLAIVHLRCAPPPIIVSTRPNPAWSKWAKELVDYAHDCAAYFQLPLALITIDPQNRIAGFKDEQSSAEGQIVSNAMIALSDYAGCLILVTDHLGKDPEAGLRGTSAKETNPLFILSTGETQKDVYAPRRLIVRKMRNGRSGVAVGFQMKDKTVTLDQVVQNENGDKIVIPCTGQTLVIDWDTELRPVEEGNSSGGNEVSKQQRRALTVLREMTLGQAGVELPQECGACPGLRGVKLESWRIRHIDKTIIEGRNTRAAFSQLKNDLMDRKEIEVSQGYVWMPLPSPDGPQEAS